MGDSDASKRVVALRGDKGGEGRVASTGAATTVTSRELSGVLKEGFF